MEQRINYGKMAPEGSGRWADSRPICGAPGWPRASST